MGDLIYLPNHRWPFAGRTYCPPAEQEPEDRWPANTAARRMIWTSIMLWLIIIGSVAW